MSPYIFVVIALVSTGIITQAWQSTYSKLDRKELVALNAKRIVQIANAYATKIIDYESEIGSSFMSTTVGDKTLAADYANEQLIRQLQSDGSLLPSERCVDSGGATIGLAKRKYLPCEFPVGVVGGENTTAAAEFERVALTSVPAGYTTGYSSIKGTIVIGSDATNKPFELYPGLPEPRLADEIVQAANVMAVTEVSSNVLSSPIIRFESTDEGAVVIHIEMIKNNQLTIRSDGSVPYSGDQNFAQNGINDLGDIRFSSLYGGTSPTNFGSIDAGGTASSTQFRITADNRLVLAGSGGIQLQNDTSINASLSASGAISTNSTVTANGAISSGSTITAAGSISTTSGNISTTSGGVSATGDISTSGGDVISQNANLNYQVVRRNNYLVGSTVPSIACNSGSEKLSVYPVALRSASGKPITGYAPDISNVTGGTRVGYSVILEDGSVESANSSSYVFVQQWCE